MSILSRLLGKTPPAADAAAASKQEPTVASPPPPDTEVRAREEEAIVSQAIAAGDMGTVGKWVIEGSSTRIRQLAARGITDPDQLRDLCGRRAMATTRPCTASSATKRDELLAEARRVEQQQAEVDAAAAIARHAERPFDASYVATLASLETRWTLFEACWREDRRPQ